MIKKIISHPLFSGSVVMVGGSMVVNAVNYLYHLLMGRILGPVDYGSLASIYSLLYIISIVPISSSFAVVKFISTAKNEEEKARVYYSIKQFVFKLAIVSGSIIALISPLIANFLHLETISVFFVAPILFLSLIILVDQSSMQGVLKFYGVVIPNLSSAIFKLIFGLIFVYLGFSVAGATFGIVLGMIVTYFVTIWLRGNLFQEKVKSKFQMNKFFKYAFPVLIQALAFTSIFTFDVILVKHYLPAFDAGLYASLSMLGKIIYFASSPLTAAMFPIVSGRRAKGEKYKSVFLMSFILTCVMCLMIVIFYWLLPEIAIGLLYGEKYLQAKEELVWMGAFISTYTVNYTLASFLISVHRTKIVYFSLIIAILQIIGIILWHSSILVVIQVSFIAMIVLFCLLSLYIGYDQYSRVYLERTKDE